MITANTFKSREHVVRCISEIMDVNVEQNSIVELSAAAAFEIII